MLNMQNMLNETMLNMHLVCSVHFAPCTTYMPQPPSASACCTGVMHPVCNILSSTGQYHAVSPYDWSRSLQLMLCFYFCFNLHPFDLICICCEHGASRQKCMHVSSQMVLPNQMQSNS